jgi:hypothetical protein
MTTARPLIPRNEFTDFLDSSPTAQEIIDFRPSETLERRALELLQRNREDRLTPEERAEMHDYMRWDQFITFAKANARRRLAVQRD